jgi:murein DD-endopeptidase MepM/ murein hydrolase activator NlpD
MICRRTFLSCAAASVALPRWAFAAPSRLTLSGSLAEGGLVVGKTEPGSVLTLDGAPLNIGPSGDFVFGLTYDQTKPAVLAATFKDGTTETRNVVPVARQYEIQRINGLPEKMVTPPPDVLERRKREIASIAEARKHVTDAAWFAEPFDWPIAGIVSEPYGGQRILNGEPRAPHLAMDIANAAGTPIRAPAPGLVSLAGPDFYLEGGLTILDHGQGVSTCYLHQSKQLVKVGDKVERGTTIGLVGLTGRATGPHLHWGLNWFQMALDPSLSTRTPLPAKV